MERRKWGDIFKIDMLSRSAGVPYVRAACPTIDIISSNSVTDPLVLSFAQNVDDDVGGVIWDCGLLLVDCVLCLLRVDNMWQSATEISGDDVNNNSGDVGSEMRFQAGASEWHVLDLGTGTGVAGIVSALNGVGRTTLTDYKEYDVMKENLTSHCAHLSPSRCDFFEYSWGDALPPQWSNEGCGEKSRATFDFVLAGDILYNSKCHAELESTIRLLSFKCMLITYKRRHDDVESTLLAKLEDEFVIEEVIFTDQSNYKNFSRVANKENLHILELTRR